MNFLDILYIVFYWINLFAIFVVGVGFFPQMLYYVFFWVRPRHWPEAKSYHEIAILIPAHNESDMIGKVVSFMANDLDYPKDKYKIYVCAHNCTDDTAKIARKAGATVFVYNDSDPAHAKPAYPLKFGFQQILAVNPTAELFVRFDADTLPCKSFLKEMNKSFDAGAQLIRAYQASSNLKQNIWTKECALFFVKDSRINNTFRQFFHGATMLTGPGMAIARPIIEKINGWDSMSSCEDAEFGWKRLFDGYKTYFNPDAIVYSDQPSSYSDSKVRMVRLGHSTNRLFFTDSWRMLVMFFRSGNPMYLDMYLQVLTTPMSVMCFVWFPLYYASWAILMLCELSGVHVFSMGYFTYLRDLSVACHGIYFGVDYLAGISTTISEANQLNAAGFAAFIGLLNMAWQVILEMSAWCIFQSWICLFLDNRKLGLGRSLKGMWGAILLSPFYSFVYGYCNCLGAITNPRWVMAKRNPAAIDILSPLPNKEKHPAYFHLTHWDLHHYQGDWWAPRVKQN